MRERATWVFVVAVGAAGAACRPSPTSISLILATTESCADLKGVAVAVTTQGTEGTRTLETGACADGAPEASIGSVTIVPGGGNDAKVTIRVVAGVERTAGECERTQDWRGCIVARRTVRFAPDREIDVPVLLRRECKSVGCDESSTCVKGRCRSASIDDPFACVGTVCDEESLRPNGPTELPPDGGAPFPSSDAGTDGPVISVDAGDGGIVLPTDGGPVCGASEKICGGACVSSADPAFGCLSSGCSPCPELASGDYACAANKCVLLQCKAGFKKCGSNCVAIDVAHGCSGATCAACDATHGTAGCNAAGACTLTCSTGFKLCGGKCVSVNDPTYGCSATGCSATACPNPGAGTLACSGSACVIGSCAAGTKKCGQKCVPTDEQNGCQDASRCSACPTGNVCAGTPTVCTCVPEPAKTTCAGKSCGTATNNCGQTIQCQDKCAYPDVCGGGSAGANGCGCTSNGSACDALDCDYAYDNCGRAEYCGRCNWPDFCGGAGGNRCGAPADGNCGWNWAAMGTFSCDNQRQVQTICNCYPPLYYDPASWSRQGDCYTHFTGNGC